MLSAFVPPTPLPSPGALAGDIASFTGTSLWDAAEAAIPYVVMIGVLLTAVGLVLGSLRIRRKNKI